ncbi:MAG: TPM domain-containing protein [Lachnospiraceae bacterium]|nr:TPM domain-containing protein [Lachnospiraceae bacterium]
MDYVLLTTDFTDGLESREYAKDFYQSEGFGYNEENGDGNLLLIDMGNRHIEMITKGTGVDFIRDEEVEAVLDEVTPEVSDGNYAEAARVYASKTHDVFVTDSASGESVMHYLIYAVIALVAAGLITFTIAKSNRAQMTAGYGTYGKEIKVNPKTRKDRFIRTITTATPKPKKQDSDGGGGSMDSSGFGGGGRDF